MSVKKYLTLNGLTYFLNKIKTYLTSSTYLNSIGISNSDIDDIADDAGYSSGSLPASEDIFITGDIIPNTDNSVDLGASSKNIKMIYTKGITINGTQFLPSDYVDLTNNQTVGGQKIFSSSQTGVGRDIHHFATSPYGKNTPPVTTSTQYIYFSGNTASQGFANGWLSGYIEQTVQTNGGSRCRWLIRNTDEKNASVELLSAGNTLAFRPSVDKTMLLGLSSHKWKDCNTNAINGLNPGALSLPSTTLINVASSITALDGTTINTLTPQVNGWLILNGTGPANDGYIYVTQGRIGAKSANGTTQLRCAVLIPVVAGVEVSVTCKLSALTWANIATCQGNV